MMYVACAARLSAAAGHDAVQASMQSQGLDGLAAASFTHDSTGVRPARTANDTSGQTIWAAAGSAQGWACQPGELERASMVSVGSAGMRLSAGRGLRAAVRLRSGAVFTVHLPARGGGCGRRLLFLLGPCMALDASARASMRWAHWPAASVRSCWRGAMSGCSLCRQIRCRPVARASTTCWKCCRYGT